MRPNIPRLGGRPRPRSRSRTRTRCAAALLAISAACAPDAGTSVHRVRVSDPGAAGQRTVTFDLSWDDAFRDSTTWNAVWVFLKYRVGDGEWTHASLSPLPAAHSAPADDSPLAIVPAADGRGVFLHRTRVGRGPVESNGIGLRWDANDDGVSSQSTPSVRVFALDMVRVPSGAFYLGDGEIGNVAGHFRSADRNVPFLLAGEDSLQLGGSELGALGNGDGYGMATPDDFGDERSVLLPAQFPKGARAFYLMRYELTEGQYAAFLNTLDPEQQGARNPAAGPAPPQPGVRRYSLSSVPPFFSFVPDQPAHRLSWADAAAFADWAALRPFTELEYEKAARGRGYPEPGAYAWGTTRIHRDRYALALERTQDERVTNPGWGVGNAAFVATMGEPTADCHSCVRGPLAVGAFARDTADAEEAGASPYGVFELSGNLIERVVAVGSPAGRRFDGRHGDGQIGSDGRAAGTDISTWPGAENRSGTWVVRGAEGSGLRGGGWNSMEARLRVSDRAAAAVVDTTRDESYGYRFARTDPEDVAPPPPPLAPSDSAAAGTSS